MPQAVVFLFHLYLQTLFFIMICSFTAALLWFTTPPLSIKPHFPAKPTCQSGCQDHCHLSKVRLTRIMFDTYGSTPSDLSLPQFGFLFFFFTYWCELHRYDDTSSNFSKFTSGVYRLARLKEVQSLFRRTTVAKRDTWRKNVRGISEARCNKQVEDFIYYYYFGCGVDSEMTNMM